MNKAMLNEVILLPLAETYVCQDLADLLNPNKPKLASLGLGAGVGGSIPCTWLKRTGCRYWHDSGKSAPETSRAHVPMPSITLDSLS